MCCLNAALGVVSHKTTFLSTDNTEIPASRKFTKSPRLAARSTDLITALAGKNKRSARMAANARKDNSIPVRPLELETLMSAHIHNNAYF